MFDKDTLLLGQVLQIRDKIAAKRHHIPGSLQGEWSTLFDKCSSFDIKRAFSNVPKGKTFIKPRLQHGATHDLKDLKSALSEFNSKIGH